MRRSFAVAALAAIVLFAVVYLMQRRSPDATMTAVTASEGAGSIPSPEYLFEHPDTLKDAEQKCQHNSDPSSLYCSNVQRAESLRMADQYRRAAQPKGTAR
jgi:hypothetical protein